MTEKFGLENPYDLVYDGKWTWTKLAEMAETVASDLNGDGVPSYMATYSATRLPERHRR